MVIAPIHDVVPENAWDSRVREDVGVAYDHLVAGERPVALCAACIVIVNERDRILGHPPDESRRFARRVSQPPVLAVANCLLEDTLGREVKGSRGLARSVDPVANILPILVLIVAEAIVVVLHVAPQLADRPSRLALSAVQAHVFCRITLHEVEPPRIEANLQPQPPQPDADALLHPRVRVVDVRRGVEALVVVPWGVLAAAVRELVA
mmetsp:Transcript_115075/g.336525  ORF Transcript_115075/g.336525 Transcript_115075/m.336525 type:complete len:208 (-) Transcript_115075:199-822(-)